MNIALYVVTLVLAFIPALSVAGTILGEKIEDKGTIKTEIGHNEFKSSWTVTLPAPDWGNRAGTFTGRNREVFVIDRVITEHFYNVYPVMIHIPQPIILLSDITIPFFMATGSSETDLSPLPTNGILDSAEMQDGYGIWHSATITSFFDVFTDLPLTGLNGEQYQWDLSGFSQTQGNFYLAEVTMTVDQFSVPIPATVWLFGSGLIGIIGMRKKSIK